MTHRVSTSDDVEVNTYLEIAEAQAAAGEAPQSESRGESANRAAERDAVAVIDFGSQYSQLIARRVREHHVYCELIPHDAPRSRFEALRPKGYILSGGPASVYAPDAPLVPGHVLESGKPILGICYGMQALAYQLGGEVEQSTRREYGPAVLHVNEPPAVIFRGLPPDFGVWMSHGDVVRRLPPGFCSAATSDNSPAAAMWNGDGLIGLQFHPEVVHTSFGSQLIGNYLHDWSVMVESSARFPAAWTPRWSQSWCIEPSAISSPASSSITACSAVESRSVWSKRSNATWECVWYTWTRPIHFSAGLRV
jgi:GMP synthase (glutamine-hydrolysing)